MAAWNPSAVAATAPIANPFVSVKDRLPTVVCAARVVTLLPGWASEMPVPAERPAVVAVTAPAVWVMAPLVVRRNVPVPSVTLLPRLMPPLPATTPRSRLLLT